MARGCECVFCHRIVYVSAEKTGQVAYRGARNHNDCRTVQGTGGGLMDVMSGGSTTFFEFRVF